jgi:peptide deformylase|tara:strand:+ start:193 stop:816 length:624 start_codon:yes stop_codon:yes gene_type:complete
MKKVINCIKEHNPIINKKLREVTVEEGLVIATELFQILNKRGDGIGLAANQVGIDAQVAVVNVRKPLVLINPKIISKENEVNYYEGCLSFPGRAVSTKRYRDIIISTEQEESKWYFSGAESSKDTKGTWEVSSKHDQEQRLLESVCIQHEIDHLNGKTVQDRKRETTVKVEKKIGRNQLVTIKRGDAVKVLKYKKAHNLLNQGWVME